jgi:hypothetical protein
MFLHIVNHTSSEKSCIVHYFFCPAPNLLFRILPLLCLLFFYLTLLTVDIVYNTFGFLFPMTHTLQKYWKCTLFVELNTYYVHTDCEATTITD